MEVINFSSANCKNCYKCIRTCSVKAIRMNNNQAQIVEERCITCGTCLTVCPQNAKTIKSDVTRVKHLLAKDKDMVVSLAPSFAGAFSFEHYSQIVAALKKLGFSQVYQTSVGARLIAQDYIKHYNDRSKSNIITTACPTINYLVQKYYPELVDCLIPVVSPMEAHGRYLKDVKGHSEVVFIGPCISKKVEIHDEENFGIDAALTFEELKTWLSDEKINPALEKINERENSFSDDANFYPIPGGSFKTIEPYIKDKWRYFINADGLENCKELLEELKKGLFAGTWIEMNACHGSCSNGPAIGETKEGPYKRMERIKKFAVDNGASKEEFSFLDSETSDLNLEKHYKALPVEMKMPSETEIRRILGEIGKYRPEHELNCGVCGYNSCREKAIAVYNGMAETYMCMPYMRTRAESISNLIIENTPNAIIVVDVDMKIQAFNKAAEDLLNAKGVEVNGKPIGELFDDRDFRHVSKTRGHIINKKVELPEYGLITLQNIFYLLGHSLIIGIINDVTDQEKTKEKSIKLKRKTVDTAQEVIEKQMRVAQEIASVLGETTAETKVLLNKIKQLLIDEIPED